MYYRNPSTHYFQMSLTITFMASTSRVGIVYRCWWVLVLSMEANTEHTIQGHERAVGDMGHIKNGE